MTPGFGRDGSPEDQAADLINSSDESLDDLMEGTEINDGDDDLEFDEEVDMSEDSGSDEYED